MNWLQKICSPIMTNPSGKPQTFYHGTKHKFENFEHRPGKRYVLFSEFDVNTPGHFFAEDEEYAREFGPNILKRNLNINKILLDPGKYPHMGVDNFPHDLEQDLRYILQPLIEHSENGDWIEIGVSTYPVKDDDWIYYAVGRRGLVWDALDNPQVVRRMQELGYDATYVDEGNGKRSIFVLDNNQILPVTD